MNRPDSLEVETPVDGCQHCGAPKRLPDGTPHAQRWTDTAGWHGWTAPTQVQIKTRMLARRAARIVKETPGA